MAGAPEGNQNAHYGSLVRGAIRRALAENAAKGRESLLNIAHKLIDDAEQGNLGATRELFDRIDGMAEQNINARVSGLGPIYGLQPPPEA